MKNTKVNPAEKVLEFIKTNPGSTIETITEGAKLSNLLVRKAVRELEADKIIEANDEDGGFTFSGTAEPSAESETTEVQPVKDKAAATKKKKDEDLGPKTITGRDNSKYKFGEHRRLPKGRLVLELIRAYVDKNPKVSLTKLQEVFHSKELQPRYGVVIELEAAKKFSKGKIDRHFIKNAEDIIKLASGTKVVVSNQWTADNLNQLLKIATAHPIGFKVNVEKAAE